MKIDKPLSESKDYLLIEEMDHGWISVESQTTTVNTIQSTQKFSQLTRNKTLCALLNSTHNPSKFDENSKIQRLASVNNSNMNKDIRILQNHEKLMEVQNKWTGNGKFIIKNKSTFLVSLFFCCFFLNLSKSC
jgi:hypothetical protein